MPSMVLSDLFINLSQPHNKFNKAQSVIILILQTSTLTLRKLSALSKIYSAKKQSTQQARILRIWKNILGFCVIKWQSSVPPL